MAFWSIPNKITRRTSGAALVPGTAPLATGAGGILAGQLVWDDVAGKLYIGGGDDGSGNSTAIKLIGGFEAYVALSAAYTLTSQTAAQKLFNATATGALTLAIGAYEFECKFSLSSMSATSGSFGFALGGTWVGTQEWQSLAAKAAPATATAPQMTENTAANTTIATANTTTTGYARVNGIVRVTAAGTLIPSVSLGVASAAIVGVNSFFKIRSLGPSTISTIGPWS